MYRSTLSPLKIREVLTLHDKGFDLKDIAELTDSPIKECQLVIIHYNSTGVIIPSGTHGNKPKCTNSYDEDEIVILIIKDEKTYLEIAEMYGVSLKTIHRIAKKHKVQRLYKSNKDYERN